MKIDWKKKLTSRKLWLAVATFVAGLTIIFDGDAEMVETISGCIMSGGAVVAYIINSIGRNGKSVLSVFLFGGAPHNSLNALDYIINVREIALAVSVVEYLNSLSLQ